MIANELMVNEDEDSVYRRHLSNAVLEQMFSTIRERKAKPSFDDDVIDDLNEFMLDEENAHEMIDLLFEGISEVSFNPQVQTVELVDVLKLNDQPILNAIQKYCSEIIVTMGDLQQKQKSAKCRPKLAAGIKQKIKELKQRDPRPYKYEGDENDFNWWFGKLFPVNT
ncbi:unnamed protein product [Didymodactylos carnosus]|uniref:Uncharacterized protein n=1 Tax=Didymodactylos carnosus TaxID=1234261 RepID=A0A815PRC5_9BILA|nr:unnamed protein product [Didymodactylos carnosus]CAF1453050.1 unnamed protein product [Didymodactylos carnosus]CAF3715106.1 unnamed protein product [Didymodactylos carnosus]CAF4325819.1 unnamed protein product [Didymodactylos carnosus]